MRAFLSYSAVFLIVTAAFFVAGYLDRDGVYDWLTDEDGPVEWVTALVILVTGVLAVCVALRLKRRHPVPRLAVVAACVFALACLLAGMEEISYGQRIFGWESSEFFVENSSQPETNIHNVLQTYLMNQGWRIYKTRHFLSLAMGAYGLALPMMLWIVRRQPKPGTMCYLLVPPFYLAVGFALGCHFTLFDWPTGYEEEIGEAYLASCILIVVARAWVGLGSKDPLPAE
jgi:peptidoglycan/LPS O-acetylase OafA/YrhL